VLKSVCFRGLAAGILALNLSSAQAAADSSGNESWQFNGAIYLWGASIGGTTSGGDDIDISFSDLIDNLDMAFMGTLGAQKGKWTLLTDVIYLNVSNSQTSTANLIDRPVTAKLDVGLTAWIVNAAGAYAIHESERTRLELLGGARYLYVKPDLEFRISEIGPFGPWRERVAESDDFLDAVVGLRGKTELSDKWYLNYLADIGTGQSDLTWQLLAGFNYRFSKLDAGFGYRYMKWEFDDYTLDDMDVSGPYAGVRFRF
jgi:hypothetical protein